MMAPKLPPKPQREQAKVLFRYDAQNDDELTIIEGDIITIISKENEDAGWWKGELNGRIALFPDNFVEIIKPQQQPTPIQSSNVIDESSTISSSSTAINTTTTTLTSTSPFLQSSSKFSLNRVKKPDRHSNNSNNNIDNINNKDMFLAKNKTKIFQPQSTNNIASSDIDDEIQDNNNDNINTKNSDTNLSNESKLFHLTKQRPKIPSNSRRPPSLYLAKDFDSNSINDELNDGNIDNDDNRQQSPTMENGDVETFHRQLSSPTENINNSGPSNKESSSQKIAPWISELREAQEAKRQRNINKTDQIDSSPSTSTTTATLSSLCTSSSSSTTTTTAATLSSIANNRPSMHNLLNKTNSSINTASTVTTTAKPFVSKQNKPTLSNQNNDSTTTTITTTHMPTTTTITATTTTSSSLLFPSLRSTDNSNNIIKNSLTTIQQSTTATSDHQKLSNGSSSSAAAVAALSPNSTTASSSSSSLNKNEQLRQEIQELRTKLNEMNINMETFMKQQQQSINKMQMKIDELTESELKLKIVIKDLINDWAEQKKQITFITIELERLKKLDTTV